ncbi:MAG: methionine--tRNA ligase [Patescibacteria group bacterium]
MYLITTSRPYTNSNPHIGTAIDAIWGDTFNRFFARLRDGNTYFSMGTDEHSFKIADKALEQEVLPKAYVDKKYKEFKDFYDSVEVIADNFMQSSDPKHHWFANIVWNRLFSKNLIYKKTYEGLYCNGCEDFYAPSQLINGRCPIHPNLEMQQISEDNYFFKLSSFKDEILDYLEKVNVPDKSVISEMKNFTKDLVDISISRDRSRLKTDWGVVVNADQKQVMYVWFEALLTYLTPIVDESLEAEWHKSENKAKVEEKIWSQLRVRLPQNLQIIGRDNAKFHLVIYPAILAALDLPKIESCIVHGMINDSQGRKFAKSLGNGFAMEDFVAKFGTEGVRFYVLHDVNSIGDTNFDWQRTVDSYNANLADNFGNLVVRVTTLVEKNLSGFVDLDDIKAEDLIDLNSIYTELKNLNTQRAMQQLFVQYSKINQFLEENKPWILAKDLDKNLDKLKYVLNLAAKCLLETSKVLAIFLPKTGQTVYEILSADRIEKATVLFPKVEL